MHKSVALKCGWVTLISLAALNVFSIGSGQEPKETAFRGRLPAYYGDIVTEEQRQKIYSIQGKYAKQITSLKDQLEALENKRDAEVEAVLSAEQKGKLKKIKDETAAKKKKTAEKKAMEANKAK